MSELRRILLVEDSEADIELTLSALAGHRLANEVVVARDGAEALDFLLRQGAHAGRPGGNPAVVLLDLKMPRVDGLQVLARIKSDPSLRAIPVLVVSAWSDEANKVLGLAQGHITKPIAVPDLLSEVSRFT